MTRAVVDASVAVKWLVDEKYTKQALQAYDTYELLAPTLIYAEVASALSKAVIRRELIADEGPRKMLEIIGADIETVPDELLAPEAVFLATRLNHSVYDCFYLALAEAEEAPLITADRKLVSIARGSGLDVDVVWLGDVR